MPDHSVKKLTLQIDAGSASLLLRSWKEKLAGLEMEAQGLREQIETLQGQFGIGDLPDEHMPEIRARLRAPKGQNLATIIDYLSTQGPKRTNQIADALGLKVSSVSSVLQGNKERFANKAGLWSLTGQTEIPAPEVPSSSPEVPTLSPMRIRVRTDVLPAPIVLPRQRPAIPPPAP